MLVVWFLCLVEYNNKMRFVAGMIAPFGCYLLPPLFCAGIDMTEAVDFLASEEPLRVVDAAVASFLVG